MPYVRNAWYVSAWANEIAPERPVGVRILNEPIVIWRSAAGHLAAFEDRCVHRFAPLSLGRCEGESLRCMYHGFLYDRAGHVIEIPGEDRVPASLRLRPYPIVERHGWLWIWMGDATAADERLIPPIIGMDHPDYACYHGQIDYAAEARYVNDNLLDLSHVGFLHAKTFNFSDVWGRERPIVTEHERSVRSDRWIRNAGKFGLLDAGQPPVDTYIRSEFYVPGVLYFTSSAHPAGTAATLMSQPPELHEQAEDFAIHAVTPLTERTARYFYMNGALRRGNGSSVDTTAREITEKVFSEDKTMIEAQQGIIDVTADRHFLPTTADKGVILFNRLVERLAQEELDMELQTPRQPNLTRPREHR